LLRRAATTQLDGPNVPPTLLSALSSRAIMSEPWRALRPLHPIEEHGAEATRRREGVIIFARFLRIINIHIRLLLRIIIIIIISEARKQLDPSRGRRPIRVSRGSPRSARC
jgi:hypothetical protein